MRYVFMAAHGVTLCVAGCSRPPAGKEVDIANAARAAQVSVDNYAAEPPAEAQRPAPPLPVAVPAPVASPTPIVRQDDGATGAATMVERYFALVEQRKYDAARQLWDRDGAASGLAADAFAASFDKYEEYHASVGPPGRIDSGAGQRYVTVPVKVHGTLRSGQPFAMEGPVTLHRAGDIDGATEAQRRWRIHESGLKPRPAASTP